MNNFSKRISNIKKKICLDKEYMIDVAIDILKRYALSSFIEKIDVAINLNFDKKSNNNNIYGSIKLPYSLKKNIRIAVFVQNDSEKKEADLAGADLVGSNDLYEQIKKRKINFDVMITSPNSMKRISKLGHILGPKNVMPNIQSGTITSNITDTINDLRFGIIHYKSDKYGIIHASIGRTDFSISEIKENLICFISSIQKSISLKFKGIFLKKIVLSSTMGPGILIDKSEFLGKK